MTAVAGPTRPGARAGPSGKLAQVIAVVAGVAGSGKSTVGALVARRLGWVFEDGDALHPPANVAKMRSGQPLSDADREPWLRAVGEWMDARIREGVSAVVACSALKRSYRDLLRSGRPAVRIAVLVADRETLAERLAARHGHFFPRVLLDSQLAAFEPPAPDERALVARVAAPPERVATEIIRRLGLARTERGRAPGAGA